MEDISVVSVADKSVSTLATIGVFVISSRRFSGVGSFTVSTIFSTTGEDIVSGFDGVWTREVTSSWRMGVFV